MPELCAVSSQPFLDESPSVLPIHHIRPFFCFTQTCDCGWCYFLCIGGWDALLLPYWNFFPPLSSVRCLPSFDLSYFCCVPRGMNSPSINISIVISAGRLRVTFRKMSWNWFLTFISQSGWGLFLARRVFTHPLSKTILKLKGYSVSAQGLAQIFCGLVTSPGRSCVQGEPFPLATPFSSSHRDVWMADRWGWASGFNSYAWRWEVWCDMFHVLGALPPRGWPPVGHPPPWKALERGPEWCWSEDAAGICGTRLVDMTLSVFPPVPLCPEVTFMSFAVLLGLWHHCSRCFTSSLMP